jgi:hypothetical protein
VALPLAAFADELFALAFCPSAADASARTSGAAKINFLNIAGIPLSRIVTYTPL